MARLSYALAACLLLSCLGSVHSQMQALFVLPPLRYAYNALEPKIDNETMFIHHTRHHNGSIGQINRAVPQCPDCAKLRLHELVQQAGNFKSTPTNVSNVIRNHGGSCFNHAMYWLTFRPSLEPNSPSSHLNNAVSNAFGSFSAFHTQFNTSANALFGSGWVWLVYKKDIKKLAIVSTPNQDNPLMSYIVTPEQQGIPILGIDLWEHAHYLKHRNLRAPYVQAWWDLIDWQRVSRNFVNARRGRISALYQ